MKVYIRLAVILSLAALLSGAKGMMGVGVLMQGGETAGGGGSGAAILTESSSILTTEAGDPLRTE